MKKTLLALTTALSLAAMLFTGCESTSAGSAPASIHPREYTFDLIDGGQTLDIVYNQYGPNYQAKCDFTTLVKKDKPQAGDTVYIKGRFTSNIDLPVLFGVVVDPSQAANYWKQMAEYTTLATDIVAGEPVELDLAFTLTDAPVSDFTFMLQYDNADQEFDKVDKPARLTFERVCDSTDTRNEVPSAPHVSNVVIDLGKYAAFCEVATNHPWENGQQIMSIIENYRASPEVTSAWGDDLPVAGDTITLKWKAKSSNDISHLYAYIVDCSEQAAWWKELSDSANPVTIADDIVAGVPFECEVTIPLTTDAIKQVNVIIQYDVGAATPDGGIYITVVRD